MKRAFITFSNGKFNEQLTQRLRTSISHFSNYQLIVYGKEDFNLDYDTNNPQFWKSGFGFIYKVLSCIKSLESYDEVVWIDTDCVVTNYIDKIWFESWRLNGFPLLPKYRFSLFGNNISNYERPMDVQIHQLLESVDVKSLVSHTDRKFYSQACFILFDKSCLQFFQEVLSYFDNYDAVSFPYRTFQHGAFGDESIINYLFWKYNYTDNLGHIFLCSSFFNFSLTNFIQNKNRENFNQILSVKPEQNVFENILFFHGTKSLDVMDTLLNTMIQFRKKH